MYLRFPSQLIRRQQPAANSQQPVPASLPWLSLLILLVLLAACGPFADATPTSAPAPVRETPTLEAPAATSTLPVRPTLTIAVTRPPVATATRRATGTPTTAPTSPPQDTPAPARPTQTRAGATATPVSGGPAQPGVTPSPRETAARTAAPVDPAVQREVDLVEEQVSALRGLEPKEDVRSHFATPDEIRANLERDIRADYSADEARQDVTQMWLLRLLDDPALDLIQLQIDLLGEQVAGYYDPEKDELFVRQEQGALDPMVRETLAHELVHALQDQHYDLEKLRPTDLGDDDRVTAVTALVEGDATVTGIVYAQQFFTEEEFQEMIEQSSNAESGVLDRAPAYIRESLLFPYVQGVQFATQLIPQGGFRAFDRALQDPPVSTEQILHPEKYLAADRDNPLPVSLVPLTDTLGSGWTLRDQNTLGEFDLQIMLRENGAAGYEEAAAGWGGTAYAFYQGGDQTILYMGTRWDSARDADQFEAALRETFVSYQEEGQLWSDAGRSFGLIRSGDVVTLISGTDRAAIERALAAAR